jgi:hypothetical protein
LSKTHLALTKPTWHWHFRPHQRRSEQCCRCNTPFLENTQDPTIAIVESAFKATRPPWSKPGPCCPHVVPVRTKKLAAAPEELRKYFASALKLILYSLGSGRELKTGKKEGKEGKKRNTFTGFAEQAIPSAFR